MEGEALLLAAQVGGRGRSGLACDGWDHGCEQSRGGVGFGRELTGWEEPVAVGKRVDALRAERNKKDGKMRYDWERDIILWTIELVLGFDIRAMSIDKHCQYGCQWRAARAKVESGTARSIHSAERMAAEALRSVTLSNS